MNRIKELREKLGLTQFELAIQLKVQPSNISMWEQGLRVPREEKKKKLANLFGVSIDYLMGYDADGASYYNNPEIEAYAEKIHKDPSLRMLFDASKDLSKRDIDAVVKFIRFQKKLSAGELDND